MARGRGWGCGSWAEGCSWGWERTAWAGGQAQLNLAGAHGGEWWVRFCESALGLPAISLVLLLAPACGREASCTLSGAQFRSLYVWSVAVSAIVPRSPGKATNVSLACILSLMHLRLSWAVWTQHFPCEQWIQWCRNLGQKWIIPACGVACVQADPHGDAGYSCSGSCSSAEKIASITLMISCLFHLLHPSLPGYSVSTFLLPAFLLWFVQWQHFYPFLLIYVSSQAQRSVPRAVTCMDDSPMQWTAWIFSLFSCNFGFFWMSLSALLHPWVLPFISSPDHLLWGCRCVSPIPRPVCFCCSMVLFHPFITTGKCSSLWPPLLCCFLGLKSSFLEKRPLWVSAENWSSTWKMGKNSRTLACIFLEKHLAQGSEPNRRVFPSWIQVCWQNERLRLAIHVLSP